jgi:hypothetical protein
MSAENPPEPQRPRPTLFLSYASEDRPAAQALRDALGTLGLEVWYDESALHGGDAWDQKIRRQIRECDYFMPVVSVQTEARAEGYFRREWRLAVERSLDMADDHTFILPVVIDETVQAGARVPEKFLSVQWTRVPSGQPTTALEALCRRLISGDTSEPVPVKRVPEQPSRRPLQPAGGARALARREYPEFPREEPGQKTRFWAHVAGWSVQSGWIFFQRLPRWVRICLYVWLAVVLLSKGCSVSDHHSSRISSADAKKLKAIAENSEGTFNKEDAVKLASVIAHEFADDTGGKPSAQSALLAIPFGAPADNSVTKKLANATFVQVYGRIAISHHGQVSLADDPLTTPDNAAAVARGRSRHASYVLYGGIDTAASPQSLIVRLVTVKDGAVVWSASYPVAGADPAAIAEDVDSKVPDLQGTPATSD